MTIARRPPIVIREERGISTTLEPVAFRASRRHPWRSYDPGNPRYRHDFDRHIYAWEIIDGHDVLCTVVRESSGAFYETHCCVCGGYMSGYVPRETAPGSSSVRMKCADCFDRATLTMANQPQDGMRYCTPEYRQQINAALGGL